MANWTCNDCKNLIESECRINARGQKEYKCAKGGWTTKDHKIETYQCNRGDLPMDGYHDPDLKPHDVGCYVTTMVVNKLGMDDNCDELNTLRLLREKMQESEEFKGVLFEYDTVGVALSKIVDRLKLDEIKEIKKFYIDACVKYTKKAIEFHNNGKEELSKLYFRKAILQYKEMTYDLKRKYITNTIMDENLINSYDMTSGGHGRFKR